MAFSIADYSLFQFLWGFRGTVQPGLHALVGATAMLGGVFRTSISLVSSAS